MTVSLTPEAEQIISDRVKSGFYASPGEVVDEALQLLSARDAEKIDQLRRDIQIGLDQLDRGECREYDSASLRDLFIRIKEQGMERLQTEQHS